MTVRRWVSLSAVAAVLVAAGCATSDAPKEAEFVGGEVRSAAAEQAPAAPAAAEDFRAVLERGRDLEKKGWETGAEEVYRDALLRTDIDDTQRALVHMKLAMLLRRSGREANALEHANEALRLRPGWDDAEEFVAKSGRQGKKAGKGGDKAGDRAAKGDKAAKAGKKAPATGDAAAQEAAELRKKVAALKESLHALEMDRGLLEARVHDLEAETAKLRDEAAELRAKLAETK